MPLKRKLRLRDVGTRRLVIGIVAGAAFAVPFHLASVGVAHAGLPAFLGDPVAQVDFIREHNERWAGEEGFEPYPVPEIVSEPTASVPVWLEPFWAGLAAVLGQAIAVSVWFVRPTRGRTMRHARGGAATGLMWVGVLPTFLVKLWLIYVMPVTRGNFWGSAYGELGGLDPLTPLLPFGAASGVMVLVVALEPWRGPQLEYRCGRIPAVSVILTLVFAVLLFALGDWLFPGAA